jgi:putative nucleotidyltransferase with HDIG domain
MLLVALVTGITVLFLSLNRREIYLRNKQISLLLFMYFFMVGLTVLVHILGRQLDGLYNVNYYYIIPLSMAPILLTVFFDDRVGFFSNLIIAVLASLVIYNSFAFFLIQMVGGSVAVFNLATLRRRSQFFTTALYMLMVYVLAYLGINLYIQGSLQDINPLDLALLTINVLFTLSTFPLIYLFERLFGITSDLTYMELLDTSHPLLKEMATVAPGTYQHSLQVATIAEEVAKKVGANALLCHAGALFHDIGKMYNPDYFTENQHSGQNPHKLIGPLQSSVIIIDHVTRGAKLAREYRLPPEMVEFINTHHGTSRVEYFYQQYRKENPEAPTSIERDFRYPGPLPVTKEQAIVMIADSIEASARSLKNPTPEVLAAHVEKIVNGKIQDNQLVHARITFRDLNKIKREILKLLQSIYHTRISYPDASPTAPAAGDAEAAAPAQPAVEDAPSPVPAPVEAPPAAQAAPNSAIESKPETA